MGSNYNIFNDEDDVYYESDIDYYESMNYNETQRRNEELWRRVKDSEDTGVLNLEGSNTITVHDILQMVVDGEL